jgi:membrane protease YdiL (CAAX protease family)
MATVARPAAERKLLAPVWHLITVLLILLGQTAYGWYRLQITSSPMFRANGDPQAMVRACAKGLVIEWLVLFCVWVGVRWQGGRMSDLTGQRWKNWKQIAGDLLIAFVFWSLWSGSAELLWRLIRRPRTGGAGGYHFPPVGTLAVTSWLALAATAGFCEEVVYRGYLQKQFHRLTGSAVFALLAQALLFGIGHVYQGYKPVIVITVLGLEYGLLAYWRRNLRSTMLSHGWSDMVSAYFKYLWGW